MIQPLRRIPSQDYVRMERARALFLLGLSLKTDRRKHFFMHCAVNLWNSLPLEMGVTAKQECFKKGSGQIHGVWSYQ